MASWEFQYGSKAEVAQQIDVAAAFTLQSVVVPCTSCMQMEEPVYVRRQDQQNVQPVHLVNGRVPWSGNDSVAQALGLNAAHMRLLPFLATPPVDNSGLTVHDVAALALVAGCPGTADDPWVITTGEWE